MTYTEFHVKSVKGKYAIYVFIKYACFSFINISNYVFRIQVFQYIFLIIVVVTENVNISGLIAKLREVVPP